MATIRTLEQIFEWFKKGRYPKQEHFEDTFYSFWHKEDDLIPMTSIDELEDELLKKFDNTSGQALIVRADKAEERLDGHDEELEKHQKELDKHQATLDKHAEELEKHESHLSDHDDELKKVDEHLTIHDDELEAHQKYLEKHDEEFERHEGILDKHAETLSNHKEELDKHTNALKAHDKKFEEVDERLDGHDSELYKHNVRITNLETDVEKNTKDISSLTGRMGKAETNISSNAGEIDKIKKEIIEINSTDAAQTQRLDLVEEDVRILKATPRFLGYYSTNAEVKELVTEIADFAWSAETGTVWRFNEEEKVWKDTGEEVPDQTVYPSDELPLVAGDAEAGTDTLYARADHRHPSDPTKADVTDLDDYVKKVTTVWGQPLTGNISGALTGVTTIDTSGAIQGGASVCTHGKKSSDDKVTGIVVAQTAIHMAAPQPQLQFHYGSAAAYTSRIHEVASGLLSIPGRLTLGGTINESNYSLYVQGNGKINGSIQANSYVGLPVATVDTQGIANYNKDHFTLQSGKVSLTTDLLQEIARRSLESVNVTGTGNAITALEVDSTGTILKATKGSTFLLSTGTAVAATKLATPRAIGLTGVTATPANFDGTAPININVTAVPATLLTGTIAAARLTGSYGISITGSAASCTGNAASATKLATPRPIGLTGVTATAANFDGSAAINVNVTAVPATLLTGTIASARLTGSYAISVTGSSASCTGNAATATKLATARTINGKSFDGSANITFGALYPTIIPQNADLNNYIQSGMYYCGKNADAATLTNCPTSAAFSLLVEQHAGVKQTLTTFFSTNPKTYSRNHYYETGWGEWYRIYTTIDAPTTVSGNAATATKLATARTISLTGGVTGSTSFDGSANAAIATTVVSAPKLSTARTIGLSGVTATATNFDGSANITIPVTAVPGTIVTGTVPAATSATKLATARTISLTGGVTGSASFDGSANAAIATTVVSAPKLTTARTIGLSGITATATSFDGSANITIPVTAVPGTIVTGTVPAATSATKLATARTISLTGGVTGSASFDGSANASIATTVVSAPKLSTARTIGLSGITATATSFDGSANITIPVTAVPGTIVTGTVPAATSATKLATARTISLTGGVTGSASFDGSANAAIATTVVSAPKLTTARTINGKSFDGSANITFGALYPTIVPQNADLNTYTQSGMYYCDANATVATMKNCPSSEAFSLLVEKHAGTKQTFTTYTPTVPKTYSRNYYGTSGWGAWYRVYTTVDAPTTVSGNAGTATKLATTRTISLTGGVTGSASFDGSANAAIATTVVSAPKLTTARTIALTGGVTGSASFDGSANASIATTVVSAPKLTTARTIALTGGVTGSASFDGSANASIATTVVSAPKLTTARTIALTGGVTGSASFDGSANASIATTVVSAPKLTTARAIGLSGVTATAANFDGSGNISIAVTAVPATLLTGTIASARLSGSYGISVTGSSASCTGNAASATSVKNTQNDSNLNMWVGTQAQYDALTTKSSTTIYHII